MYTHIYIFAIMYKYICTHKICIIYKLENIHDINIKMCVCVCVCVCVSVCMCECECIDALLQTYTHLYYIYMNSY